MVNNDYLGISDASEIADVENFSEFFIFEPDEQSVVTTNESQPQSQQPTQTTTTNVVNDVIPELNMSLQEVSIPS